MGENRYISWRSIHTDTAERRKGFFQFYAVWLSVGSADMYVVPYREYITRPGHIATPYF